MIRSVKSNNVICLIDMDCFYCQVEEKFDPSLKGKAIAVVQYNAFQGGGIIAVNYAARSRGVTRHMRGDEAKKHCPEIELVRVPSVREKADLSKYREAGKEVAVVLQKNTNLLERASIDEAYLDITQRVDERMEMMEKGAFSMNIKTLENSFTVGYKSMDVFLAENLDPEDSLNESDREMEMNEETKCSNLRLLLGATIVNEIRAQVKEETGYDCSAGIAHNKILAKLACGMNKPNKQTILPLDEIPKLFKTLEIRKIRGLGAKFGEIVCETFKVKFMGDLLAFSERDLQKKLDDKNGSWLYLMCRGIDLEPVHTRFASKSIGCCKKFPGRNALRGLTSINHWFTELATEIHDRLEKDQEENNRRPQLLTVSFMQTLNGEDVSSSRSVPLNSYEVEKMVHEGMECIRRNTEQFLSSDNPGNVQNPIKFLGLSVGKFEKIPRGINRIQEMFLVAKAKQEKKDLAQVADRSQSVGCDVRIDPQPDKSEKIKHETVGNERKPKILSFFQKHFKKRAEKQRNEDETDSIGTEEAPAPVKPTLVEEENDPERKIEIEAEKEIMDANEIKSEILDITVESDEESICVPRTENKSEILESTSVEVDSKPICAPPTENKSKILESTVEVDTESICVPPTTENTLPKYTREYAEFFVQNINLEEFMKECPTCHKKIVNYEYDSHQDFHFAMALSNEQRVEFRESKKISESKSTPKAGTSSAKKGQKPNAKTNFSPMMKYLQKAPEESIVIDLNTELCSECGKAIPLDKVIEHSDFHVAKKIQLELKEGDMPRKVSGIATKTSSQAVATKRKTPSSTQGKSIATYFSNSS